MPHEYKFLFLNTLSIKVSLDSVCSPDRVTEGTELHHYLAGEVSHQPSAHPPPVVLQLSLVTDPLPHLKRSNININTEDLQFKEMQSIILIS